MYVNETIPVRLKKSSLPVIRRLKAEAMLEEGRNVSAAEVVDEALEFKLHNVHAKKARKVIKLDDCVGMIKGGPKTNASIDLDEFLYGDLDEAG